MTQQNTPVTTRPNTNPFTLTQDLARECYERYKADYEGRHHTTLDPWDKLPREIQGRWASALKPVAEQLCRVVSLEEELQDARGFLDKLQSTENRASARLSRLEDAVYDARRVLPDMIALGSVPAPPGRVARQLRHGARGGPGFCAGAPCRNMTHGQGRCVASSPCRSNTTLQSEP